MATRGAELALGKYGYLGVALHDRGQAELVADDLCEWEVPQAAIQVGRREDDAAEGIERPWSRDAELGGSRRTPI